MGIVAKYKFNQEIYADFIPEFNSTFTGYTITDEIDTDGYTIRTIGNDSGNLPTLMRFGQAWVDGESGATDKSLSLLEVYECDTSNITNMNSIFRYCSDLILLVSSNFNTSQVIDMQSMFANCSSLTSLDVSNFDTNKVTNMYGMFSDCSSLISLDVSNFDTSKVTNMSNMFSNCPSLTSLDVSNFNTEKVTNMSYMFQNCSSLTSLDISNFDTSKVTNTGSMFRNCSSLTSLDVSNFNTSQVTNMSNMFYNCSSLISLDVSNFNTSQVTNMSSMFYNCSSLISLDVSNFNTEKITDMSGMFYNCSSLISLDVSNFNTKKVTTMYCMFQRCSLLTSLDVSNFNTENVTNASWMFQNCSSLTSLDVSNFNTENVTDMSGMFHTCSLLTSLDVSNFNTEKVEIIQSMFYNCSSLTSLDISSFNTQKVTDAHAMFYDCFSLISLDISNFDTENITDMSYIFANCLRITDIGVIYCNSNTINKISDLITTDTTIWYMDSKLEDLTKKSNITYKEYKMNILESDEEINLRRIGDVYDELNLETGELTQRIGEVVLDGNEDWTIHETKYENTIRFKCLASLSNHINTFDGGLICNNFESKDLGRDNRGVQIYNNMVLISFNRTELQTLDNNGVKQWLANAPTIINYQLATPTVKTVVLKNKPSINWQGDTYLHLENNTLYPQLECEVESINYYEIPKLKANTLYTLRYVGEPTQCIFGGLTYETENNMVLTSGSSDNLLYFDKEVRKVILIEGDVRDRNFDYFEGIESLGAVEIVTHKSNMPIFAKGGRI